MFSVCYEFQSLIKESQSPCGAPFIAKTISSFCGFIVLSSCHSVSSHSVFHHVVFIILCFCVSSFHYSVASSFCGLHICGSTFCASSFCVSSFSVPSMSWPANYLSEPVLQTFRSCKESWRISKGRVTLQETVGMKKKETERIREQARNKNQGLNAKTKRTL